jgi:hypothetical protein
MAGRFFQRVTSYLRPASYQTPAETEQLPAPKGTTLPPAAPEPHYASAPQPLGSAPGEGAVAAEHPAEAAPASWFARCKQSLREHFCGFLSEFEAKPLGEALYQNMKVQVDNGEAAQMALYHYDFVACGSALSPRGKDQLCKIAAMLPHNFYPIVIERTVDNPALAEARRLAVLQELAGGSFPVPPERVVVGPPLARGLDGIEAVIVHDNLLRQTQAQGTIAGLGGGSIGGTVGLGFNAPGRTAGLGAAVPAPVGP